MSELGAADFRVLEQSRSSLVGAQYGEAQVLVSENGGRQWQRRKDVAAGRRGAGGATRVRRRGVLHRLDLDRPVRCSKDGRFTWKRVGSGTQQAQALTVDDASARLRRLEDGRIERSTDGGRSWDPLPMD